MSIPDPALEPCSLCAPARTAGVRTAPSPYALTPLTETSGFVVTCLSCGLRGAWRPSRAQAIGAWNRRVTTPPTVVPVEENPDPAATKEGVNDATPQRNL